MGHPIATDANTKFSYIGPDGAHTVRPMPPALFFSNPRYFPFWDRICQPGFHITGRQPADGSLLAISILWAPDYC